MTEYEKKSKQTKDTLEKLHHTTHECCICMEEMCKENVTATPCGHEFHKNCIDQWLQTQKLCPICRQDCTTDVTCKSRKVISPKNDAKLVYD